MSRAADRHCNRHFYAEHATRYVSGPEPASDVLWLPFDIVSIESIVADGVTLGADDYVLWPYNHGPKMRIDTADGSDWTTAKRGIAITGVFGYSCDVRATGQSLAADVNADDSAWGVADASGISVGETLLVGDEQAYVAAIVDDALTVTRAVNGTTAAIHASGTVVNRRVYPADLERAVLMQASRFFRDTATGYSGMAGGADYGGYSFTSSYPAIRDLLAHFVYQRVA